MSNPTLLRAQKTAARLIPKFGRTVQLVSITDSGPAWNPVQGEVETDVIAMQLSYKANEIDGDLVQADDKLFMMDSSEEPNTAQRIKDGEINYSIVSVNELRPADDKILYKVQVRL